MIISVLCEGDNVIEKNKNRIRLIKLNQQLNGKVIDKLYNKTSYEEFKNWYIIRATKGISDLFIYYKIYK